MNKLSFLDFSINNPGILPEQDILNEFIKDICDKDSYKYVDYGGLFELKKAFSEYYFNKNNVVVNELEEVIITYGAKEAIAFTYLSFLEKGDSVLIPTPSYPAYREALKLNDNKYRTFSILDDDEKIISSIEKELSENFIKLLILNFPSNPTGIVKSESFLKKVYDIAEKYNTYILQDSVYSDIIFDNKKHISLLKQQVAKERVIEIYSLSKGFGVPGCRIGAVISSGNNIRKILNMKKFFNMSQFKPIQKMGVKLLNSKSNHLSRIYQDKRDLLCSGLLNAGWSYVNADGGINVFAQVPNNYVSLGADGFSDLLLRKLNIKVFPGKMYGDEYSNNIRISLVPPSNEIKDFTDRIKTL